MISERERFSRGKLEARPTVTGKQAQRAGLRELGIDGRREALIYTPSNYNPDKPAALAVMLHGAGGNAKQAMNLLQHLADAHYLVLLAPASQESSWDIITLDHFGPDVIFINQAMQELFNTYSINTSRIAIGGFSDGASYALSVGLSNGDLFTHIIAFSPGFSYAPSPEGFPNIYISHGVADNVLPIDHCSRRLVPRLTKSGYNVHYSEFDGPHTIPATISMEAAKWFVT